MKLSFIWSTSVCFFFCHVSCNLVNRNVYLRVQSLPIAMECHWQHCEGMLLWVLEVVASWPCLDLVQVVLAISSALWNSLLPNKQAAHLHSFLIHVLLSPTSVEEFMQFHLRLVAALNLSRLALLIFVFGFFFSFVFVMSNSMFQNKVLTYVKDFESEL